MASATTAAASRRGEVEPTSPSSLDDANDDEGAGDASGATAIIVVVVVVAVIGLLAVATLSIPRVSFAIMFIANVRLLRLPLAGDCDGDCCRCRLAAVAAVFMGRVCCVEWRFFPCGDGCGDMPADDAFAPAATTLP